MSTARNIGAGPVFDGRGSHQIERSGLLPLEHFALASFNEAFPAGCVVLLGVATGAHSATPPQSRNNVSVLSQQPNLRLGLLQPEAHVHLAVHRRGDPEALRPLLPL